MIDEQEIEAYRQAIAQALLSHRDAEGTPMFTEESAFALADEFTDEELADGLLFNTPEEVADLLLESLE